MGQERSSGRCSTTSTGVPSGTTSSILPERGFRVWALTWVSFFPTPAHQASVSLNTRPNCSNTSWSSCSLDGPYCFFRFRRSCSSSHWFFKRAAVSSSSLVLNFACSASYSALEMVIISSLFSGSSLVFSMRKVYHKTREKTSVFAGFSHFPLF